MISYNFPWEVENTSKPYYFCLKLISCLFSHCSSGSHDSRTTNWYFDFFFSPHHLQTETFIYFSLMSVWIERMDIDTFTFIIKWVFESWEILNYWGSISYRMTSIINHQTIRLIIQWTSADGSYPKRSIFNWCCLQSPQWMLGVGRQLKTQSKATAQTIISFFPIRLLTSI